MEDMQALAITSLSAADVAKQYEHIRELGKGTYGKVDLVAHRTQGELVQITLSYYFVLTPLKHKYKAESELSKSTLCWYALQFRKTS